MSNRMLLTLSDAASLLSINRNTLSRIIKDRKLPIVKLPGQSRPKIHYSDLEKLIEERKVFG